MFEVAVVEEPAAEIESVADAADSAAEETVAEPAAVADTPATTEVEAAAESAVAEAGEEKDA